MGLPTRWQARPAVWHPGGGCQQQLSCKQPSCSVQPRLQSNMLTYTDTCRLPPCAAHTACEWQRAGQDSSDSQHDRIAFKAPGVCRV